jgi:oxygen-independent coproporphyrinogen-3 oxidase
MYALPGQSMDSLSTSLSQMLKLKPEHISCYGLKIEEGTPFYKMLSSGDICEKEDDEYADMYDMIRSVLLKNDYKQYELSNFSHQGYESKHNIKYWTLCDYIGIGLGASSLYKGKRFTRAFDFDSYLQSFENSEFCELSAEDSMSEYMILTLRLVNRGAHKKEFENLFGKSIEAVFGDALKKHIDSGFITDRGDSFVLSEKAYYISNSVLCDFI